MVFQNVSAGDLFGMERIVGNRQQNISFKKGEQGNHVEEKHKRSQEKTQTVNHGMLNSRKTSIILWMRCLTTVPAC